MTNAVGISQLQFSYEPGPPAVLDIPEFAVRPGEKVFVYGPSGSGKSTFLELLAGVLLPTAGKIELLGSDLARLAGPARDRFRARHVGYIFQSFNLLPYLSVDENIALAARLSPARAAKLARPLAEEIGALCEELGIAHLRGREVGRLSVGQQQRVACARALLGNPELILADEPTSALDQEHREKFVRRLFAAATAHGSTVLFVSHDRTLEGLFDRSFAINPRFRGGEEA